MYCGAEAAAAAATDVASPSRGPPLPPRSDAGLNSSLAGCQRPAEHEARRDATAVHNNRLCAARACVGHADDGLDQTGGAELPPRGACDRDAVDADAAPRPPAKAVLNSLSCRAAGDPPGAPLRRSFVKVV